MDTEHPIQWPNGARCAVSLTFDVDADVGECWRHLSGRLTSLSEAQFGARRGLSRLAEVLRSADVRGTFYVPGEIAELHPDVIRSLFDSGHEIGHHGFFHLANDQVREVEQRDEILRGIESLERVTGRRPTAYRSPGWELTHCTLDLLLTEGFDTDSSCMGDDRPYRIGTAGHALLELPIHWSLDDWVYFRFTRDGGGIMSDPDALLNTWQREILSALDEGRHVTLTMHPEVMGRGYRAHLLTELIAWIKGQTGIWIATHAEIAAAVGSRAPLQPIPALAPARSD